LIKFAINEQALIGWYGFQKGLISKYWKKAQQSSYNSTARSNPDFNSRTHNGEVWAKRLITEMQDIAHSTWCLRNRELHGETLTEQTQSRAEVVRQKIRREYAKRFSYSTSIQWKFFNLHIRERVCQSTPQLTAWLTNLSIILKQANTIL